MKKNIFLILSVALLGLFGCNSVELPSAEPVAKVSSLEYTIEGRNVTLTWTLPVTELEISHVVLTMNSDQTVELGDSVNTYTYERVPLNEDLYFTAKVAYANGRVSEGVTVSTRVEGEVNNNVAMLIGYESVAEIEDDDEKAAAQWFEATMTNGTILTPTTVLDITPDMFTTLWIHIDRVGINIGWENLPAPFNNENVLEALRAYTAAGGNLLLTVHATQLTVALGVIPDNLKPGLFGNGSGAENADIWGINPIIGSVDTPPYSDNSEHPAFEGMDFNSEVYATHAFAPLIGAGVKEDHNCMWDLNTFGYTVPEGSNTVAMYEAEADCEVLGTWQHVGDFCCAGMVDFHAQENGYGRIVCVGVAAYEWHQNVESNPYQANIEKMTENILNELTKTDDGGAATLVPAVESPAFSVLVDDNTVRVESNAAYANFTLFAIDGRMMGKYSSDEMKNGVELPGNGCYIMQAVTLSGKTETTKFIK